jgi:lambda repressor-like predicted transcriptional regulator
MAQCDDCSNEFELEDLTLVLVGPEIKRLCADALNVYPEAIWIN